MNKTLITTILGIFLISLVSATTYNITSGESVSFDIGEPYEYYLIDGNSTEVDLNISQNGVIVTILIDKYMQNDNFTITFYGEKGEVIGSSSSGGGGSCKYNQNYDWNCSEWSGCVEGMQTRICKTRNNCGNFYGKPNETQSCSIQDIQNNISKGDESEAIEESETISNIKNIIFGVSLIILTCVCLIVYDYLKKKRIEKIK
jgi:hypothetical protein